MVHVQGKTLSAFTLIELLIVVAIIAILAAIAVPNFLEAQTRAKVSRCEADMRALSTALEIYFVDNRNYPIPSDATGRWYPLSARMKDLTTPIAYISSIPPDPFPDRLVTSAFPAGAVDTFDYFAVSANVVPPADLFGRRWRLASAGPDLHQSWGTQPPYDPTNGTKSVGDILLLQGGGIGDYAERRF